MFMENKKRPRCRQVSAGFFLPDLMGSGEADHCNVSLESSENRQKHDRHMLESEEDLDNLKLFVDNCFHQQAKILVEICLKQNDNSPRGPMPPPSRYISHNRCSTVRSKLH